MPQILESLWLANLYTFWITIAKIAFDHCLILRGIKDATIGTG